MRVTLNAGVISQIPTLTNQFGQLKTAASSFVDAMNNKAVATSAVSKQQQTAASAGAAVTKKNISGVIAAYNDGVASALASSRAFSSQMNNVIKAGAPGGGAFPQGQAQQMRESATLAGPGAAQFARAEADLKKALAVMDQIDRRAEMALQRARMMTAFARESTMLSQEQTGVLKGQQTTNFAILAAARSINDERKKEFMITREIGTLAGRNAVFGRSQSRIQDLEAERAVQMEVLGIDKEKVTTLLNEGKSITSIVDMLSKKLKISQDEFMVRLQVFETVEKELQAQRDIQVSTTQQAAELYVINTALKNGEMQMERMREVSKGIEEGFRAMGAPLDAVTQKSSIQVSLHREMGAQIEKNRASLVQANNQFNAQAISFARQPFLGGLGRMPRDPGSIILERQAVALMGAKVTVTTAAGPVTRRLSEEEARLMVARASSTEVLKRYNQEYQISNGLMRRNRAQLINNSIGMFVLSITITQTVAALEQIVKAWADSNEGASVFGIQVTDLAKFLNEMNQVIRLSIGPIQVYTAIMQLASQANAAFFMTALPMLGIFGSLGLLTKAFTAEGKKMRQVFSLLALAISSAATALAAYNLVSHVRETRANSAALAEANLATATNADTIATMANNAQKSAAIINGRAYAHTLTAEQMATLGLTSAKTGQFAVEAGLFSLKTFGLGAALVASIVAMMVSIYATTKAFRSFDTQPGEYKTVKNTGPAMLHANEIVSTPAQIGSHGMTSMAGGEPYIQIINNVAGNLDTSVPRVMARQYKARQIGGPGY